MQQYHILFVCFFFVILFRTVSNVHYEFLLFCNANNTIGFKRKSMNEREIEQAWAFYGYLMRKRRWHGRANSRQWNSERRKLNGNECKEKRSRNVNCQHTHTLRERKWNEKEKVITACLWGPWSLHYFYSNNTIIISFFFFSLISWLRLHNCWVLSDVCMTFKWMQIVLWIISLLEKYKSCTNSIHRFSFFISVVVSFVDVTR